jgi:hypothetical protein
MPSHWVSSPAMDKLLKTDDLTVILAVCFVAVYGISKYLKPQRLATAPAHRFSSSNLSL